MTGTYTQESVISNLTLALLDDSGSLFIFTLYARHTSILYSMFILTVGTMYPTNMLVHLFGVVILAAISFEQVVNNGSIRNLLSSIYTCYRVKHRYTSMCICMCYSFSEMQVHIHIVCRHHYQLLLFPNVYVHIHTIKSSCAI
jgi:hypothetical protein